MWNGFNALHIKSLIGVWSVHAYMLIVFLAYIYIQLLRVTRYRYSDFGK